MFGFFRPTPVVYYKPDPGDVFGSIMAFLVLMLVLFLVFAQISMYILFVFLGIGCAIGLFYAIVVYVRSFVGACRTLGTVGVRNGLGRFLLKWAKLFGLASWYALKENFAIAQNALIKAGGYRFLSFKKWMWLVVAPTVLVCGALLIVAVIFLQLFVFFSATMFLVGLVLTALALLFLAGTVYAVIQTVRNIPYAWRNNGNIFASFDFSKYPYWKDLFPVHVKGYFGSLFGCCKDIFVENWNQGVSNFQTSKGYSIFSIVKYFLLITPVSILLFSLPFLFAFVVFFLIVFPLMLLANVIWIVIAKIFFH